MYMQDCKVLYIGVLLCKFGDMSFQNIDEGRRIGLM